MKLEYGSKSLEYDGSGAVSATKVTLVNANGANVPILLPADKISLSNTELFELALESLYEENFPNRAENEKFSKVAQELQKNKEATDKAEQAATENKENLDTVSAITEVLIHLIPTRNGQKVHKLSLSSKCKLQRATHTKSSHYLICYNKAC